MALAKQQSARKIRLCQMSGCHNQATTVGYCRLCYLKNWKKIRADKKKKASKNLNKYIENVIKASREDKVAALKGQLQDDVTFEKSLDDVVYREQESVRGAMSELGYNDKLDGMIDSIKIDDTF